MIKVDDIRVFPNFEEQSLKDEIAKVLNIEKTDILDIIPLKKSIDARKKPDVNYVFSLGVSLKKEVEKKFEDKKYEPDYSVLNYQKIDITKNLNDKKIVIVGFGPAGMFCGLTLAKMGFCPIIIEQGKEVDERQKDIENFWTNGKLNRYSNVQFGEGGAGTFSDGKLNTNLNNAYCKKVINEFYHFGAPKEILFEAKPHIGSDNLKQIVKNIREEIIKQGGIILFNHKLTAITVENDKAIEINVKDLKNSQDKKFSINSLVLALGHSARDTFEMLHSLGVKIAQKPFAMGVRIEQNQKEINISQYGEKYIKFLPNADYKLAVHLPNNRSVFTFCMCPGGEVVASSSNEGEIVTNGMSNFLRDKTNANSAVLVNVTPEDYGSNHALAGIYFQEKYEKLAFELGGKNYFAPCQTVGSFLNTKSGDKKVIPSYRPNVKFCEIDKCLPNFVAESIRKGLPILNNKLKGFANPENVMTAIESRSSCPITILRDEHYESNIKNIFPAGEGAGYAGGIVSSAVDGIKIAEEIYKSFKTI